MPFLVVYSTSNKLKFKLYDYYLNDIGFKNSYGWEVIAVYRFYKNHFVNKDTYFDLRFQDRLLEHKRRDKLEKVINILEKIKNALWSYNFYSFVYLGY